MISSSPVGPLKVISLPRTCVSTSGNCRSIVRSSSSRGPSRATISMGGGMRRVSTGASESTGLTGALDSGPGVEASFIVCRVYVGPAELLTTKSARSALCRRRVGSWTYIMCPAS